MNNKSIENYLKMKIGIDEPFKFHCTQCGECCFNRDKEVILLSANDIFRIAKSLKLTPGETVKRYGFVYIGADSRLPIVILKTIDPMGQCVLLKENKCAVHDNKPVICAMFPIGRMLKINPEESEDTKQYKIEYLYVNPECGDDADTHTVSEWLYQFGISLEDKFFAAWSLALSKLSPVLQKAEEHFTEKTMQELWDTTLGLLYLNYDISQDFDSQFGANVEKLMELVQILSQYWDNAGQGDKSTSMSDNKGNN
ncbi:YkgJ family cysteine cluster protein [Blautia producta]|uniref:YkgJ family cysteine cluster protein n=1 Tax=Blautia producta TaxID=33035 RepID=UPI001D019A6E|nr:YkgJ family cysteine cluster protein [Blautia producta]MCB5873878.1 YkgJ family cysteine cluster protein [Blautia producta]